MNVFKKMVLALALVFSLSGLGAVAQAQVIDGQEVVIPYLTSANGWWAGLSILNKTSAERNYKVFCWNESGQIIGENQGLLGPFQMATGIVQSFAPVLTGIQQRVNLSIVMPGTFPFHVTMFMGNNAGGFSMSNYRSEPVQIDSVTLAVVSPSTPSPTPTPTPTPFPTPTPTPTPTPGASFIDPVTGMEFVYVKGGCYQMGDIFGDGLNTEQPVHQVCVRDFYIGKYEVTQGQWKKIIRGNPSISSKGDQYPVENVSWDDVQQYIQALNRQSGKTYRLPTEAEWEYAARSGGKQEKYAGGNDVDSVAWYGDNSDGATHEVGTKTGNGLGLYDMSGNVWEWCQDRWHDNYQGAPTDGSAWETGSSSLRVHHGGGWSGGYWANPSSRVRTAARAGQPSDFSSAHVGFRLVITAARFVCIARC